MKSQTNTGYVAFLSLVAAIGGILFGYDTAVISGTISGVASQFSLDAMQQGWFVGCALVGSIGGVAVAGVLSDRFGRKLTMLLSAVLFTVSAVGCAVSADFTQLVVYRIVGGVGIGVVSIVSPMYISEVAVARWRGTLVSLYQLAIASDDAGYAAIAKKTFDRVLEKRSNPKGKWCKAHPGTRPIKDFALPMILCNLSLEIEQLIDKQLIDQTIETCLHEVMEVFYQKDLGLIVENVSAEDNSLVDSFEGRSVNPGHSLEAMWFIMDLGKRLGRPELIDKAVKIALSTIEYGWDKQYGGIFYFMDRLGRPQQQLEWDQKLWWVHIESAITMIKGYQLTGNKECLAWFQKLHDYMWTHFKDPKYPEWFGYLNRRGEVLLPLKGGKWKGCFHVPRGLYQIWQILEQCK